MPKAPEKTNTLIDEAVDIYQLPLKDEHYSLDHCEITIGGVHGNSMKLLFMLVKHGIVQNITKDDYETLADIYKVLSRSLSRTNIHNFNTILNKLTFNPTIGVRIIGGELADRGQNDYLILKLLQKLRQNHVPVEIMISNHSIEFIHARETKNRFELTNIEWSQVSSLRCLQAFIDNKLFTREEVLDIYQTAYLPTLKLLSYQLSDDHSKISLFSYAAIDLSTIGALARKFHVTYNDDTATSLAKSIDRINLQFQKYATKNQIHTLYDFNKIIKSDNGKNIDLNDAPVEFIMWNRNNDVLDRLPQKNNYTINYIHVRGKNTEIEKDAIFNLDSTLGYNVKWHKSGEIYYNYGFVDVGHYRVLHTPQSSISFALELDSVVNFKDALQETKSVVNFKAALQLIETKSNDFSKLSQEAGDAYSLAHQATLTLHDTINRAYETLAEKTHPTSDDVEAFKNTCQNAINASRPVLEAHRGWKQVLGHLTLAVAGMGAFYLMGLAAYYLSGSTFTLFKTDSHQKLDNLAQTVDNFTEDACQTLKVQR